jgi:hypothetical protein
MSNTHVSAYRRDIEKQWSYNWWQWIMKYKDLKIDLVYDDDMLDWQNLSENPNASLDILRDNIDEFISNGASFNIFKNPNMTWDFVAELLDRGYNPCVIGWCYISMLKTLPLDFILNNQEYPWEYKAVSRRSDLTLEIANNHKDKPWDWDLLNQRQINAACDNKSNIENIAVEDVKCCSEMQRCHMNSTCPNTLFSEIDSIDDKSLWCWRDISNNLFTREKANFITQENSKYCQNTKFHDGRTEQNRFH